MAVPAPVKVIADRFQLVGTTLDRKFKIERIIAEGGFGILYYGTHLMLDRPIALKVLKTPPDFNEQAKAQFIDGFKLEAKTIVKISHPNIVQVLDFGVTEMANGEMAPWMVLEWLNGDAFRDVLLARRGQGGRSPVETLNLMRPALEALAYAHEEGIAHRDIKPANMMLVPTRRGNVLKLLDFGIAKVMEEGEEAGSGATMTTSSLKAFSLAYAAPEQIGGSRTGPWTDVHAMASIFTEVLTDLPPYDGKERTEICCDVLSARRPTPAKRNMDTGPWEPVLAKALALRPSDRFQSAGEFLASLEQALGPAGLRGQTGQYPAIGPHTAPPGTFGTVPPGSYPQGVRPGTYPPGSVQPGTYPPGAVHAGTYPPGVGQVTGPPSPFITGPAMFPPVAPMPHEGGEASNPTTLRGHVANREVTAGASPSNNGKLIIGACALIGVLAIGGAVMVKKNSRNAAAVSHVATTPVVTPPVVTPPVVVTPPPVVAPVVVEPPVVAAVTPTEPTPPVVVANNNQAANNQANRNGGNGAAQDQNTGRRHHSSRGNGTASNGTAGGTTPHRVTGNTQLDVD